ncbi:MAG: metallophosphoesterase family protein [Armatimonadota bacterium]|nr:metallophosphoesterase family protein [Armatimonadota bacterium]
MRYGILSDIHANLEALDAVLARLEADGVSAYLCLGDVVGYGADPNACCERIRALPGLRCVAGNHDQAVLDQNLAEWFHEGARVAAEWTAHQLTPQNRAFLAGLPETLCEPGFEMVHGSLADPVCGYVLTPFAAADSFELQREPLCLVGHVHAPLAFARRHASRLVAHLEFRTGQPVRLSPGTQYLVGCGSVGQPRDGNPMAACAVYDSDAGVVECVRVPYDVETAGAKIRRAGLPPWLADRLATGR